MNPTYAVSSTRVTPASPSRPINERIVDEPQRPVADCRQSGGLRAELKRSAAEPKRKESDGSSGLARDYVA
jgi:hypothetical protein